MLKNRLSALILVFAMLCTLLVSCGETPLADVPAADLLNAVMAQFEDKAANVDIYRAGAGEEEEGYFDPSLAGQIFLGEFKFIHSDLHQYFR